MQVVRLKNSWHSNVQNLEEEEDDRFNLGIENQVSQCNCNGVADYSVWPRIGNSRQFLSTIHV
jgi:hypothetical protein